MSRIPICVAFVLFAALVPAASPFHAPTPPPGPEAVIAMHEALFSALDSGDTAAIKSFLSPDWPQLNGRKTIVYLPGIDGKPLNGKGYESSLKQLLAWAEQSKEAGGNWHTRITQSQVECNSEVLSYAVLEFERTHTMNGKTTAYRYNSTSLLVYRGNWRLFHWHVSPASPAGD